MLLYQQALAIAKDAHKGQVDKAGVDYIQHPLFVASLVEGELAKTVALLHDVVEDSDWTLEDLRKEGLPEEVVQAVGIITKKRNENYEEYILRVKQNPLARQVKLADLQHNSDLSRLANVTDRDRKRVAKYQKAIAYLSEE
ncbi:HD domain-containing protein [uncultured Enterococcus sp.]|uniref:HD domain-containing protein n=1 Tax=uncultured Enterococcus sp. TaxID=167972 RepID=UPI00261D40A6|nr:HD domain-containing protein [uncultured Enterococcus sp.]